ncbi:MAG: HU family DNA-binding protein [Patescibacteria group bacterium]|nr:HU family DNA-binding protein [Patescibacteria group bacterium]
MNKGELIEVLAQKNDLSKAQADKVLNSLIDIISGTLKSGGEVAITGFGNFSAKKRAARQGVNPRTGEKIKIAAMNVPKFKPGKGLKDAIK